jgi:hypothetical protein
MVVPDFLEQGAGLAHRFSCVFSLNDIVSAQTYTSLYREVEQVPAFKALLETLQR